MLSENKSVRQRPGDGFRRWFIDSYFDLILWYTDDRSQLTGFQLCYEKNQNERALTCKTESGKVIRSHRYVTSTYSASGRSETHMTAILKGDAGKLDPRIAARFGEESGDLEPEMKQRVLDELKHFL